MKPSGSTLMPLHLMFINNRCLYLFEFKGYDGVEMTRDHTVPLVYTLDGNHQPLAATQTEVRMSFAFAHMHAVNNDLLNS
jgi:hypothetical protein